MSDKAREKATRRVFCRLTMFLTMVPVKRIVNSLFFFFMRLKYLAIEAFARKIRKVVLTFLSMTDSLVNLAEKDVQMSAVFL